MIDKRRHPSGAGRRRRQTTQGIARHLSVGGCGKLSAPAQPQLVPGLPGCLCQCRARSLPRYAPLLLPWRLPVLYRRQRYAATLPLS